MLSYVSRAVFDVPVYALVCANTVSTVYNIGYTMCVTGYIACKTGYNVCKTGYNVCKTGYVLYKTGHMTPHPEKTEDLETALDLVVDHDH